MRPMTALTLLGLAVLYGVSSTMAEAKDSGGSLGSHPELSAEFSLAVEPPDGTNFDVEQLPSGIVLSLAVEPFRKNPLLIQKDWAVKGFATMFDCSGYHKASKDEFFRRDYIDKWRGRLRQALDVLPDAAGHEIEVPIRMRFGEYDFKRGGFPITEIKNSMSAARVSGWGCEDAPYNKIRPVVFDTRKMRMDVTIPESWQPLLEMSEEEARKLTNNVDPRDRIVTGTMPVQTTGILFSKRRNRTVLSAMIKAKGPINVQLRNAPAFTWTLEQPEIHQLDGRTCTDEPEVSRTRMMGADGLPYWVTERSCTLLRKEELPTLKQNIQFDHTSDPEIEPVEQPEPLAWNHYRATLVRIGSSPNAYSQDSEIVNELAAAILETDQKTLESIAPRIASQSSDAETPVQQLLEGELGEELRALILEWARDMAQRRFVGVLKPSTLEFEIKDDGIEFESLGQENRDKLPNNLRVYRLATPEDAAQSDLNSAAPVGSELQMARDFSVARWDGIPREKLQQIKDFQSARALIVFTARYAQDMFGSARMTGNLEHVVLEFSEPPSGDKETQSLRVKASDVPSLQIQPPPLKVASRRPSPEGMHGRDGIGVDFDRKIEPAGKGPEKAIDLQCGGLTADAERTGVEVTTEVQGKTLKIYPANDPGSIVPAAAGLCEYRVGTEAVEAANNGGRIEDAVTYKFDLRDYSAWDDAPKKEVPPPGVVDKRRGATMPDIDFGSSDGDGKSFDPVKVFFGSEISAAEGVDLAERVSLRCDGQAVPSEVSITAETLTVKPSGDTSVDEGAPCTLSVAPDTVRRAEGSDTLDREIRYEFEL